MKSTLIILAIACLSLGALARDANQPNVVIIFTDDQGYRDVGCFGATDIKTANLDRMAAEGIRFTDFHVAQAVCSASRASLLTGCYPNRIGIKGALGPNSKVGLSDQETTIAQLLKARGYATGMVGKWHLGDHASFLPIKHGFDEWFGLAYSHDMWPKHEKTKYPDLPLYDYDKVVTQNPDPSTLTTRYTERAVSFIERQKDKPFFLYVAHNLPHVPLGVSEKFKGKSERGLYGDVIMEIDWSVGQILDALKRNGLDNDTLVIFTSDNGPWLLFGNHGGQALPLREGKATSFEGGLREPFIARWPGKIQAGAVCAELACTMDLLPTIAKLTGAELPARPIDGKDIWPLLSSAPNAKSPHEFFYYYWIDELQAVRAGKWKLHVAHNYTQPDPPGKDGHYGKYATRKIGQELFDLEKDVSESHDVAAENPKVVEELLALAERAREDLGDSAQKRIGKNIRPPGKLP